MTKYGVGVGEEFPVDDRPEVSENDDDSRCCGQGAHASRKEAWRRFRHHMKAEWHARRHGFGRFRGHHDGVEPLDELRAHHIHKLVIGGLALIGIAAILSALNSRR